MEATFEGRLARVEVPDLLTFVNLGHRTGVLETEREEQATRVYFAEGEPVFASSNKVGLRLGDLLQRMGKVSAQDMDRCIARHRAGGDRLGQVLVSEGLVSGDDLMAYLKVQVSEVIFDTFTWADGRFAFYDDVGLPKDAVTLEMNLQNLLMEGVRRLDERGRIAEVFPDLQVAMEALTNPELMRDKVALTPAEWRVFFLVDGKRSLQEVCQLAGDPDELATLEILQRLQAANLIARAAVGAPAPSPAIFTMRYSQEQAAQVKAALASPEPPPSLPARTDDSAKVLTVTATYYTPASALTARLAMEGSVTTHFLTRDSYSLGRGPRNDIVVKDPKVSNFHARLDRTADGFRLVDLRSTNGCIVNGERTRDALLKAGDRLTLGSTSFVYAVD